MNGDDAQKLDKPPIPLLSPVRSTLRDTLCWSWIEVESHDKHGKNVCVDYLMKWGDWSREGDQRWQKGGWLLASFPLTIVFPGRQPPNLRTVFWRFALAASKVGAFVMFWRPTNLPQLLTLSEKNNIRGHVNFWLKSYIFKLSFIFLFKAKQPFFQSFKPILPSAAPSSLITFLIVIMIHFRASNPYPSSFLV